MSLGFEVESRVDVHRACLEAGRVSPKATRDCMGRVITKCEASLSL